MKTSARQVCRGLLAGLLMLPGLPHATEARLVCQNSSPAHVQALVELYTSEGCSSCPPADQWLSALANAADVGSHVVSIAFHVDYWDRLGWPDRFASPRATQRQRSEARESGRIYTPQIRLQGQDFPRWYEADRMLGALERIAGQRAEVDLSLDAVAAAGDSRLRLSAQARTRMPAGSRLHWVGLRDGLVSDISRGENAGRQLRHDRVVGPWFDSVSLREGAFSTEAVWPAKLPLHAGDGLAAWVQAPDGRVLQALDCRFKPG